MITLPILTTSNSWPVEWIYSAGGRREEKTTSYGDETIRRDDSRPAGHVIGGVVRPLWLHHGSADDDQHPAQPELLNV